MKIILVTVLLLLTGTAWAQDAKVVRGVASVIDGDTIEISGQRIRLMGVDAPESSQSCGEAPRVWPCGRRIAEVLDGVVGRKSVACDISDTDRYQRKIGECFINGQSINAWLVSEGMAMAYRAYSQRYVTHEESAKAARKGIWSGPFVAPWLYRKQKNSGEAPSAPQAVPAAPQQTQNSPDVSPFHSCAAARAAGLAPVRSGQPGYSRKLDRDGDGVACE